MKAAGDTSQRIFRAAGSLAGLLFLWLFPAAALAIVEGTPPAQIDSFSLFGSLTTTGNTLMEICSSDPRVNCTLLPFSEGLIRGVPPDAEVKKAYIWWSGSIEGFPDNNADLTLPDGSVARDLPGDTCLTASALGGFFYCRKDVTDLIRALGVNRVNGAYRVGNVRARPGYCPDQLPPNPPRPFDPNCQARYAAWSMAIVWSSPSAAVNRNIILYDGFYHLDENEDSPGIAPPFTIGGFVVGNPARAEFTFFGLEGDKQLGVPPQDNPNDPGGYCPTCEDFIKFNGQRLSNETNPPGNIWNSTLPDGSTGLGVDIDAFNVGAGGLNLVRPGDTTATIQPGVGDGVVPTPQGGGGESVFLGWMSFATDSIAPNFRRSLTRKSVDRLKAAVGETLTYTIVAANEGTAPATNVVVRDSIPTGTSYLPNSTVTDCGVNARDVGGTSALVNGLNLGTLNFVGNNSCTIQFRVRINPGAQQGSFIENRASITAKETEPTNTNTVRTLIEAPRIAPPEKKAVNVSGGQVKPNDEIRYIITLRNQGDQEARDLVLRDEIPLHLNLLDVFAPSGQVTTAGRSILVTGIVIPANSSIQITIRARVDTPAEFAQKEPGAVMNGYPLSNQAYVEGEALREPLPSDDPDTQAPLDPTIVRIVTADGPNLTASTKTVNVGSGARVPPGTVVLYTLTVRNAGNQTANNIRLRDTVANDSGLEIVEALNGGTVTNVPGGRRIEWTIGNLAPGASAAAVQFRARVSATAANGKAILNQGFISFDGNPNAIGTDDPATPAQGDPTVIFSDARPDFSTSRKEVSGAPGGVANPGDVVNFTITVRNTGNGPASSLVITDVVDAGLSNITNITPAGRGTWDAQRRVITWNFDSLGLAPETLTLGFSATIRPPDNPESVIRNKALIRSQNSPDSETNEVVIRVADRAFLDDSTKTVEDVDGDGVYNPGDVIQYRITVVNSGRTSARNVVVRDTLDSRLFNISAPGGAVTANTAVFNLGTLAPGDRRSVTIRATISEGAPNGAGIPNQAVIESPDLTRPVLTDDPVTQQDNDPTIIQVSAQPSFLASVKLAEDLNGGRLQPGDILRYTIVLRNSGDSPASNVTISDLVAEELTNVQPLDGGRFDAPSRTLTWSHNDIPSLKSLPPQNAGGVELQFRFTAQVRNNVRNGTRIENQAEIWSAEIPRDRAHKTDDPNKPGPPQDPTVVTVISGGDLSASTKRVEFANGAPATEVRPGDRVVYVVTIINSGTGPLSNLRIEDPLDQSLGVDPADIGQGGRIENRTIIWDAQGLPRLSNVGPGDIIELRFTAVVRPPSASASSIANTAIVNAGGLADPHPVESPPLKLVSPDLSTSTKTVTLADGTPLPEGAIVRPGDELKYSITLVNTGTAAAENISVRDAVRMEFLENIRPGEGGNIPGPDPAVIVWDSGSTPGLRNGLPPNGAPVVLIFTARVKDGAPNGTEIPNQAEIQVRGFDKPVLTDDPRTPDAGDATRVVVRFADLSNATKTVEDINGGKPAPGDVLRYSIRFRNTGTTPIRNIAVEDAISKDLEEVKPERGGVVDGDILRYNAITNPELAELRPGQEVVLVFTARIRRTAADRARISNQAVIRGEGMRESRTDDPTTPNIQGDATVVEVTAAADLNASPKTYTDANGGEVTPGDQLTFVIIARNRGDAPARNVVVRDELDMNLLTDIQPGAGRMEGNVIRWDAAGNPALAEIPPGGEVLLSFSARVKPGTPNGSKIRNQALLNAAGFAEPARTDWPETPVVGDPVVITVVDAPSFTSSTKEALDVNGGDLQPGDVLRYIIRVRNTGSRADREVRVIDSVPRGTSYAAGSVTLNGERVADGENGAFPLQEGLLVRSPRSANAGEVIPDDGQAPEDEIAVVAFDVRINLETPDGTVIRNQALVRGVESQARTDNPLTPAIKGDATVVVVGRGADLSAAVKRVFLARDSGVTGVAEIGDVARYQIQVVNGGNVAARRVKLLDPIPDAGRYLTGSCVVDGRRATDQNDAPADGVQFLSREGLRGTIEWLVGDLAPGQSRELLFDAEILQEPVISNQGVVSAEGLPEEPTDADGNDSNGDQPTVLSVGRNSIAGLQVIKSAEDLNGGVVESLDDIRFVLTLANNSGERLAGVELLDSIPARMTFRTGSALAPAGVSVDFAPPPRGDNQRGLMRFANITLEPGQSLEFAFTARVDVDVKTGDALVNRAAAIWNTQRVESNPVTLTAGAAVGSAGVGGVLYIETGGASSGYNGAPLAEGGDLPLPGFQVVLERVNAGSPTGATSPLRKGVSTDAAGRFLIGNAPPGNYVLHYYSSGGARFGTVLLDELKAGETRTLDIAANTTGRLYNVRTGQPIAGARLTLIYDRDDPRKPGEPVAASDLPVGQQGQMTDFTGFYRFDLEPGRRYAVQVDPPSSGLIFPSSIRPPRAAAFNPGGDAGVDSRAIPSAEADSPYVIRFQLDTGDAQPTRNHIPLDPLRELVRIEKKANKQEITLGDIVTYVIRLDNKASSDITIDPSSGRGGVSIVDAIPRGFKYVKGSAQYASGLGPQRVILSSGDPEGAELLRFGPYVLPASSSVTLRYQLVAGSGVKPGEYVNRAIVQGDGGAVYSNEARATVRVIQDPVFDQNMITGKVFCDDDGDGFQDDGEPGIGGARIYSEEGDELITDVAGRYHISALNPGYHLIKIDANSLPPGAEMISETAFGMNFTRGLNFKVNFAARCQWDRLKPQRVLPRGASSFDPRAVVEVWKDPASAVIRGEPAAFPAAEVVVRQAGESRSFDDTRGRRFVAPAGGKTPSIVAYTRAPAKKHPVSRWELLIETPSGETVWRTAGDGAPPAEIPLDGAALRARVTAHGAVFLARLRNHHAHGVTAESAPAAFALYEEGELELYRANWSQGAFGEDMTSLAPSAAAELSGLSAILRKENPANVFAVLEAHTDSASGADAAKIRTGKQLETVASQLRMLGVPAANITLRNLGADQPVADDTNVRGRIANRRFGIRIHSSRMAGAAPSPPRPPPALAIINGENIGMDGAASASRTLELQPGATLLVKLHDGAGRAWTLARRRTTGGGFQIEEPAALAPRDVVSVDLRGKEIAWGASRVSLPPRNHECTVSGLDVFGRARLEDGKLSAPLEIAIADVPDGAASWSVRIEPDGKPVFSRSGTETPAKVIWRGEGLNQVSRPDDTVFRAVCEVSHGGGVRVSVPSAPFGLRPPEEEEQREWMISADEFDEGGSAVRARLKFRLREAKKIMDRFPAEPFIIEVHHDDSLPPDKALELTAARAAAVKEALAGMGAAADRMTAMGKGMENPVTANRDGISRQVNRRIVIRAARGADEALKPLPSLAATPTVTIGDLRASAATAPVIAMPVQAAEGATITVRMVDSRGVETIASIAPPADPAGAAARRMEEQLRKSTAASLEVELPPAGVVKSDTVFIRGFTDPANQLLINGQKAEIDEDGFFAGEVPLPKNTGKLTIASVDKDGNEAVVEREYLVERDRWFLLALGDGLLAGSGTRLDGLSKATTARLANDSMLLHGRLVLYLRGQWESEGLIRKGGLTAHLDTAKQREREFFQLVDDPDRYYPIYGDWARERRDVNARDKLYLRFDANNSMALVGNYQTEWNDADLMRFERSYYGAKFDFNETLAEHYKTRVRGFGAMGDRAVQHRRSELASTGGTVYFLRDRFLMEGSEVLTAVVRDRDTGMKLYSRQLERQTDYVIDYMEGRVILKQPINYALAGDRAFNAAGPRNLAGHPVFIGVEYDFVSPAGSDRASFGLHLRETFFDTLTVGGGYIREGRGAGDDYHLIGGELGLQFFKKTRVRAEFAHSISQDAQSWYSADGGLTYAPMIGNEDINLLSAAGLDNGNAFKLTGEGEVGEYIGRSGDYLKYRGYFQKVDPGFFAGAMRIEQGFLKFGGEGQYSITDADSIALRHDSLWANRPAVGNAAAADSSRHMSSAIYRRKQGAWNFAGEFAHTYWSDPVINGGVHGDAIAGGVGYRFNPVWYVFGEQEVVLHGDEFRYPSIADQFTTTAGVNVQITQWLQGELAESLRPSGDNATSAGLKMKWSDKMDVYARERFSQRSGQFISTTIFGASDEPAKGSRTYGEYQIDATGKGNVDRAVLGMNNRWELSRGWFLSANYERQQVVGNYAALLNPGGPEGRGLAGGQSPQNLLNPGPALDGVATDPLSRSFGQAIPLGFAQGDSSRDVLSTGVEFLKPKLLQTSARLEFRYDNGDERFGGSDRFQFVTANGIQAFLNRDFSVFTRLNYVHTHNLTLSQIEARVMELTTGFALRPVRHDWVQFVVKYTRLIEEAPLARNDFTPDSAVSDVFSISPLFETPFRLQIAEKVAIKHMKESLDGTSVSPSVTLLWINRVNLHLWLRKIDLGGEYRMLTNFLANDRESGFLADISWLPVQYARVAFGYNWTRFTDNEYSRHDFDASGFFLRVSGQY